MAESFLFNIAENVLEKVGSVALQEIGLAWGVKSELNKLEGILSTIKAVLLDAEEQQVKNHQLSVWLGKLKDVCYDAEDVLDEFEYEALQQQVVTYGRSKTKVRNFFLHPNLKFRFKMGHRLKEIRERLNEIAAEKAKFHLTERVEDRCIMHRDRETHSFVQTSDVIGRDYDKENIVQLLMRATDNEKVSIIPIVGMGGLGKTTLAKLVYNDRKVVSHFQLKMWLCVSEDFDVKKLAKEIIKSATIEITTSAADTKWRELITDQMQSLLQDTLNKKKIIDTNWDELTLDQMQSFLRDILSEQIFLLILDDVWNEDRNKWIELKNLLTVGANGSKIIVTTRSQSIASFMGTVPTYKLEGLPHEDCMSVFVNWAFRKEEDKQYPNLLKIGNEIVKKCGGVPLAVRTLGSLLYSKTDERDWLYVKENDTWKLEQKENDILPALKLSYDAMPTYLKRCFSFCSLFPKDYEFNNVQLIQFWVAQGLLQSFTQNQDLEVIGQQYINELRWRSFFQDVEGYKHFPFIKFRMHDLIHDLASSVAQTECSIVNSRTQNISKRVRHVAFCEEEEVQRFSLELDNARSILFPVQAMGPTRQSLLETYLSRFKYLRVLSLHSSPFEVLPSSIGNLKHLRYLDLRHCDSIKKLPSSICKLHNLQTLVLSECFELEGLPRDIGHLTSLRHFALTTKQMFLPNEGIGCLKSLRYLEIWQCGNLKSLGEGIQHLTALQSLLIIDSESLESLPLNMKYLTALETLVIWDCENLNLTEWEEDIHTPRLGLRWLTLSGLPKLVALPSWLQGAANSLHHIYIGNCKNLMTLPEWMQNLMAHQKLVIEDCTKLSTLPRGMQNW